MFFTILVFIAALALEGLGSYLSVLGLASHGSFIMICFAIILDFSKVMIATVLYKKWSSLHVPLKAFFIPVLLFLMVITSSGTYAFLVREFSKTTLGQEQVTTQIELLKEEKTKLETRKKEIDGQISQLPSSSVVQRKRMTDLFDKELTRINERVDQLDKDIPKLTLNAMGTSTESGTLGSIAKSYGTTPEQIAKILAFFMTLVVDPSAIGLLIIANFLMEQNKKETKERLMQRLKGELPDDEKSLLQRLKNKVNFLKYKSGESNFFTHNFFGDSKTEIVHKAFMKSTQTDIPNNTFITSIQMMENPKVYIPVKYSSILSQVIHNIFFKESQPEIVKMNPKKIESQLNNIVFIEKVDITEPLVIISPLINKSSIEINSINFIIKEGEFKAQYIPAIKTLEDIKAVNLVQSIEEINIIKPKPLLKVEHTEIIKEEFLKNYTAPKLIIKKQSKIDNDEIIQNIEVQDTLTDKVLVKSSEYNIEVIALFDHLKSNLIKTQSTIMNETLISNINDINANEEIIESDLDEILDSTIHIKPFIKMNKEDNLLWKEKERNNSSFNIESLYSKEDEWDYQPNVLEGYTEEELEQLDILEQELIQRSIQEEEDNTKTGFNVNRILEENFI